MIPEYEWAFHLKEKKFLQSKISKEEFIYGD